MECRKVLTENNATYVLFMLDAYGILRPGWFVLIAYSGGQRFVALTREGVEKLLKKFDRFERVEVKFKCDEELASALGAQVLHAYL